MTAATLTFLLIGGAGLTLLALALLVGDLFHFGHPDVAGPFSLPSVAAAVGAFGFAAAIAASITGDGLPGVVVGLVAGVALSVPAAIGTMALARAASHMRTDAERYRVEQEAEAALLDLLLRVLPQVVEAAAAPISAIDKLTVVSTDGASSLTRTVANTVAQGLQLGTDLTGVDLSQLLSRLAGGSGEPVGNGVTPRKTVAAPKQAPKQAPKAAPEAEPTAAQAD